MLPSVSERTSYREWGVHTPIPARQSRSDGAKIIMKQKGNTLLIGFIGLLLVSLQASASPLGNWGGSKNWGGNSWGGCNDWPEWTPMYWMEKMFGNDEDCDALRYQRPYTPYGSSMGAYQTPYARSPYSAYQGQIPYQGYGQSYNPYTGYTGRYGRTYARPYGYSNPYATSLYGRGYRYNPYSLYARNALQNRYRQQGLSGFGSHLSPFAGRSGTFPGMRGFGSGLNGFNPLGGGTSFPGMGSGMGGMSPMGFGSPMSPMSPMSSMSPMGGGFGSPFSSGMNPMGGGFSSPFSSGMTPFSGGMRSPFSF